MLAGGKNVLGEGCTLLAGEDFLLTGTFVLLKSNSVPATTVKELSSAFFCFLGWLSRLLTS